MQTTTVPRCENLNSSCAAEQEAGVRLTGTGNEYRLCVTHATALYDLHDVNRRGGKVELFDI